MKPFLQRYYWLIIVPMYFLCAFLLLRAVFPISVDGGGPSPTFYWGARTLHPTLSEYRWNQNIRMHFLFPYLLAAIVICGLGCGLTISVLRWLRPKISFAWVGSFLISLTLVLGASLLSDSGTVIGIWEGPILIFSIASAALTLKVALPMAAAAAVAIQLQPGAKITKGGYDAARTI